jgi:hypothetical protein
LALALALAAAVALATLAVFAGLAEARARGSFGHLPPKALLMKDARVLQVRGDSRLPRRDALRGRSMARPNAKERRPARLQCSEHDEHRYVDYSVPQVGLYVHEQDPPTWRIEQGTDLRCRERCAEIDLTRSTPL